MKKKVTAIIIVSLFLCCLNVSASSGRRVTMEVNNITCKAGEDVNLLVMVVGTEGSTSIGFRVFFDEDAFTFESVSYGTGASGFTVTEESDEPGCVSIGAVSDTMSAKTGTFAKITVHVSEDANGEYEIVLEPLQDYCSGVTALITTNGIITVEGNDDIKDEDEYKEFISMTDGDEEEIPYTYEIDEDTLNVAFERPDDSDVIFEMAEIEGINWVILDDGSTLYRMKVNGEAYLSIGAYKE